MRTATIQRLVLAAKAEIFLLEVGSSDSISFFFQAEDGIRDLYVTGVQTCALPISGGLVVTDGDGEDVAGVADTVGVGLGEGDEVAGVGVGVAEWCGAGVWCAAGVLPVAGPF